MDYKEKLAQASALFNQAKAILENKDAAAEERGKIEALMTDARRLKAEAGQLKEIMDVAPQMVQAEADRQQKDDKPVGASQFKDWTEFLKAAFWAGHKSASLRKTDPRLRYFKDELSSEETKQMVENVGASGGFLVPPEFDMTLRSVQAEASIVYPRATKIRMARRQVNLPVLDQTGTGTGVPHWFGGMQFYWSEEAHEKTYTEAAFREVKLVAHKLIGYTRASDELVDDSAISLADFLSGPMGMAGGLNWMSEYAYLRGTGAGQPLGVITAVNQPTLVVPRAVAGTIGYVDVCNMMEDFLPSARGVWVVTQSAMAELIQMAGPAGNPAYVWQPSAREGVPAFLFGMPVIWCEKSPLIGVQGDILLADFSYYLIGDRQATTVESTQFDYWRYDQTSWRAIMRVDGQPWLSAPLTYQDSTTQVSPFVILGAGGGS